MQYYKITLDTNTAWGIRTYWFEIDEAGDAERQITFFSNGNSLSYDNTHLGDEYDGLQEMVVDGDGEWWKEYTIAKEDFERQWESHIRMNRDVELKS